MITWRALKAVYWVVTRGMKMIWEDILSKCKGDFEDIAMPHKIELLEAARLSMDIDVISNSTGDLKVPPTTQPPLISLTRLLTLLVSLAP
jgi:hypothetical protein